MPDDRRIAPPVFVDPTGRRRRTIRVTAVAGASVLLGVAGLLVTALLGVPIGPLTSLPEPASGPPPAAEQQVPNTPAANEDHPTTTSNRPATQGVAGGGATAATPAAGQPTTTTTTTTRGSKPETPPGKPTDLPTPPGHTR